MKSLLFAAAFSILPALSAAKDSIFIDYQAYEKFVTDHVMARKFQTLILQLGGRDELTKEELRALNRQMRSVMPKDFTQSEVIKSVDLGSGFSQEARVFWTGLSYVYYYAFLHQREDELVVLKFNLNTSSSKIFDKF